MAALASYLSALSNKADKLLETHHQELFDLGLDVSFNRATLATKYWLPLPESDVSTHRTDASEDELPPNEGDAQLFLELRECERILQRFERSFERPSVRPYARLFRRLFKKPSKTLVVSNLHNILPNATSAFAQSVRKISRMVDARRQLSDSDSESSRPGSTALYTQDAGKAGPRPQSHGQISSRGSTGDVQPFELTDFDVQERPSSSARDEDDMLSSLPGSQTPWYQEGPQKYDTSQSPYSYNYSIGTDNLSAPPLPRGMISGEGFAPERQYGHIPRESATYSATMPSSRAVTVRPIRRDHTTYRLAPGGNEYLPSETDPSGETKVSKDGHPLGGRVFRFQTFQLPHRGDTLFMLGKECSIALGYRGYDVIFKYNSSLLKIIVSDTEKESLIQQGIIPESEISQQIAIVTARSMFRQFGARMIQDGRRVRDDYWEADARKQGFTEEDTADETTPGAVKARDAKAAQASPQALRTTFGFR